MMDEQTFKQKKEEYISQQKIITKKKINEVFNKYFTPDKIEKYCSKSSDKEDGISNLKDVLSSLEKDLSESNVENKENKEKMKQSFKTILEILTNLLNEITLFELENSNILIDYVNFSNLNLNLYIIN